MQHLARCAANGAGEVERVGVVGGMASDGVGVVVDAGNHLGAFLAADAGSFNARGGAACATKEVDVEEFDHFTFFTAFYDILFHVLPNEILTCST